MGIKFSEEAKMAIIRDVQKRNKELKKKLDALPKDAYDERQKILDQMLQNISAFRWA